MDSSKDRYEELDALRGLAAMSVMLHHYLLVFPQIFPYKNAMRIPWTAAISFSPLHIFWAGQEAVILFFVLSGFVLSLPFFYGKKSHYGFFLLKRICRIYIPYFISLLITLILISFSSKPLPGLSIWVESTWRGDISTFFRQLFMVGELQSLNPVLWSLRPEMQMSIIFPFIVAIASLPIPFAFAGIVICSLGHHYFKVKILQFISMFILGAIIARHKATLIKMLKRQRLFLKIGLIFFAVLFYCCNWIFPVQITDHPVLTNAMIAASAAVFILSAMSWEKLKLVLKSKPLVLVGKISYSLYLYHAVILLFMLHSFYGRIPLLLILIISSVLTFPIVYSFYWLIEEPSMKLGASFTKNARVKLVS